MAVAIAGGVLLAPPQALSYNADVHFSVTMWLAELAGFSSTDAFEIAKYDQATDDDALTGPEDIDPPAGVPKRQLFHFVSEQRTSELRIAAAGCKNGLNVQRTGQYLHAFQDTFSHKGFGATYGHLDWGHIPDFPWHRPGEFAQMVRLTLQLLAGIRSACPSGSVPARGNDWASGIEKIQAWADERERRGTVTTLPDDPERWRALMSSAYGDHTEYTGSAWRAYDAWRSERYRQGWRP